MLKTVTVERKPIGYVNLRSTETVETIETIEPVETDIVGEGRNPNPPEGPSVSVIIPTLNEAKNLRYVLPYIPTWVHEVIIVDGRSTDDTIDVALSMHPKVRI